MGSDNCQSSGLRDSRAATQDASRERTRVTSNIVVLLFELFSAVVDAEICVQGCRLLRMVTSITFSWLTTTFSRSEAQCKVFPRQFDCFYSQITQLQTTDVFTINQSQQLRSAALECALQDLLAASYVELSAPRCPVSDCLNSRAQHFRVGLHSRHYAVSQQLLSLQNIFFR